MPRSGSLCLRALVAACAVLAFAPPATAARPPTPRLLAQAQQQVDGGEFEAALITLQDALASPDNSNEELAQVYWRMGEVYVFMKREREAGDVFERLMYLAPDWQPPRLTSPHVRRTFEGARSAFEESGKGVSIRVVPPQAAPGARIPVDVRIQGLAEGQTARVYFRRALTEAWLSAELAPVAGEEGLRRATLPAFPAGTGIEYYAEIAGPDRRRIVGEGSSLVPLTLKVGKGVPAAALAPGPPAGEPKVQQGGRGWIWAAVGGVILVGAGVAYFAVSSEPATLRARITVTP